MSVRAFIAAAYLQTQPLVLVLLPPHLWLAVVLRHLEMAAVKEMKQGSHYPCTTYIFIVCVSLIYPMVQINKVDFITLHILKTVFHLFNP